MQGPEANTLVLMARKARLEEAEWLVARKGPTLPTRGLSPGRGLPLTSVGERRTGSQGTRLVPGLPSPPPSAGGCRQRAASLLGAHQASGQLRPASGRPGATEPVTEPRHRRAGQAGTGATVWWVGAVTPQLPRSGRRRLTSPGVAAAATAEALLCGLSGTKVAVVGGGPLGLLINFLSDSLELTMSSRAQGWGHTPNGKGPPKEPSAEQAQAQEERTAPPDTVRTGPPGRPRRAGPPRAPCRTCREGALWWPCHTSWLLPEYGASATPCNLLPSR